MLENIIYYFTGTGNSYSVAKSIQEKLEHCKLISMDDEIQHANRKGLKRVGFVYPTYNMGLPKRVEQYVKKLYIQETAYLFGVATCGFLPGNSIRSLHRILFEREYHLNYGNFVGCVGNNIIRFPKTQNVEKTLTQSKKALAFITEDIVAMQSTEQKREQLCSKLIHRCFSLHSDIDKYFVVNDTCNHCGLCAEICPSCNIELVDQKPMFKHRCEQCMSCIQYCPMNALNYKKKTIHRQRYHNPLVDAQTLVKLRKRTLGSS